MAYVSPSIVTWHSCMASRSADCVFGDARLISSTRSTFAKTGPGRNSNSFVFWLKTLTPVTSLGSRSGVNWSRENVRCERAGEGLREHGLPHAREVLDDHVPLGEEAQDAELERLVRRAHGALEIRDHALDDVGAGGAPQVRRLLFGCRRSLGHRSAMILSTSSSTAAAMRLFGALATCCSVPLETSTTSFSRVSNPMSRAADVVEDDEVRALRHRASRALARARRPRRPRRSRRSPAAAFGRLPAPRGRRSSASSSTVQGAPSFGRFSVSGAAGR